MLREMKKKLLYLGHEYHIKTRSTEFLLEMLRENFEVSIMTYCPENDSYNTEYEEIDKTFFDVLVCFQIIPERAYIDYRFRYSRGFLMPMYDGIIGFPDERWYEFGDYTILNFSRTLHEKLSNMGLRSKYIQFFPKPSDNINEGNNDKVFFWQRTEAININTISSLLADTEISQIHIHKAMDPGNSFVQPDDNLIAKVEYSEWSEKSSEIRQLVDEAGIYIAPRQYEGIGMSFLEAMSMGKCVIAPDNPTMNEYIVHGVNGYLYDINSVKVLDLSNICSVRRQAYETIRKGYKRWQQEKNNIIKWLNEDDILDWSKTDMYSYDSGFSWLENDGTNTWHWATRNEASIGIICNGEETKEYRAFFQFMPAIQRETQRIKVYFNGIHIETVDAPGEIDFKFVGMPGEKYTIKFVSDDELLECDGDKRVFCFMLKNPFVSSDIRKIKTSQEKSVIQNKMMEILAEFIRVCKLYNLQYFAFYGTLLGAVRHKDFIPWDDDIDIAMPRADYSKLIELSKNNVFAEKYYLQTMENDHDVFYGGYSKLRKNDTTFITRREYDSGGNRGMAIDILPLDYISEDCSMRIKQMKDIKRIQELILYKTYGDRANISNNMSSVEKFKLKIGSKLCSRKQLVSKLDNLFRLCQNSRYVAVLSRYYRNDDCHYYDESYFGSVISMKFGNEHINVPYKYMDCLIVDYGKKCVLCPDETEIQYEKHSGIVETDIPYKEFQRRILTKAYLFDKTILAGNLDIITKYLSCVNVKNKEILILDTVNKTKSKLFNLYMTIGYEDIRDKLAEGYCCIICQEDYKEIRRKAQITEKDNYYIYVE